MLQAKRMLSLGIITPEDYAMIDTMQREEFGISSCMQKLDRNILMSGKQVPSVLVSSTTWIGSRQTNQPSGFSSK